MSEAIHLPAWMPVIAWHQSLQKDLRETSLTLNLLSEVVLRYGSRSSYSQIWIQKNRKGGVSSKERVICFNAFKLAVLFHPLRRSHSSGRPDGPDSGDSMASVHLFVSALGFQMAFSPQCSYKTRWFPIAISITRGQKNLDRFEPEWE